jgi:hypothetical protein
MPPVEFPDERAGDRLHGFCFVLKHAWFWYSVKEVLNIGTPTTQLPQLPVEYADTTMDTSHSAAAITATALLKRYAPDHRAGTAPAGFSFFDEPG